MKKLDKKLIEKYGSTENKDFEGVVKKMLTVKPTKPAKGKGKNKQ